LIIVDTLLIIGIIIEIIMMAIVRRRWTFWKGSQTRKY
jgi:hypothetical protein